MGIKIILADDHKIVRDGLRSLIQRETDMDVVAEAVDGKMVVKLVQQLAPDLVIMDIVMPKLNGIDATRDIVRKYPNIKVIALSMYSDKRFVTGMFEAGASGYLLKDCAVAELATAVRAVMSNQTYLSPRIADVIIDRHAAGELRNAGVTGTDSPGRRNPETSGGLLPDERHCGKPSCQH
jgi:two-component system response regulator NreC